MNRRRLIAWIVVVVVDAGYIAWGGMAAAFPDHLRGPGGTPILIAGYEGFTKTSWAELVKAAPMTASYISMVFRLYGVYCLVFGVMGTAIAVTAFRRGERWAWWALLAGNAIALVSAMRYDWLANAIGPFELTEYLGVATVAAALVMTAPGRHAV